jgi:hypothetical protein
MTPRILAAILKGGLVAASVDIVAACLINQRSVPFILHTVAGGLIAKRSFAGGAATAFLGLLLQEAMGIIIAAIFVPLSAWRVIPKFSPLSFAGNLAAMCLFGLIVAFFARDTNRPGTATG